MRSEFEDLDDIFDCMVNSSDNKIPSTRGALLNELCFGSYVDEKTEDSRSFAFIHKISRLRIKCEGKEISRHSKRPLRPNKHDHASSAICVKNC